MSENENKDGPLKGMVSKMQDMVGGVVGLASASSAGGHDSQAFVTNAGIGDLYELEAGAMALMRARSDSVREFARMMVEHHTTSMHQMQSALSSSEVTSSLPSLKPVTALDERRQGMIDNLRDADDDAFDGRYMAQQKMAHQETATLLRSYLDHGDNLQLRSVARGALPMVERHSKSIERVGAH
jgi:putative membrane protein